MKPLCIYHGGCVDGFTAAWAVWRRMGEIDFHPGVYGEDPPDVTGRDVIMVDFSYKRPVIEAMAEKCQTMLILDHHKTAEADLAGLARPYAMNWPSHMCEVFSEHDNGGKPHNAPRVVFDMERSGAQIAWDFFHRNPRHRPALVDYVADRDLWRFDMPFSREVSAWIYSWDMDFQRWNQLEKELYGTNYTVAVASGGAILRQHNKNVATLIRNTARQMIIGGHSVPVANAPHFMASDTAHALAEGHPFAATYYDRDGARVFSLRSHKGEADVAAIAEQYGGGGHENAAGFQAAPGWEGDAA